MTKIKMFLSYLINNAQ